MISGSMIGFIVSMIFIASSCVMGFTPEKSDHALLYMMRKFSASSSMRDMSIWRKP